MMSVSERLGRHAVRWAFFAIPLSSIVFGLGPATSFYRDRLHMGFWPSEIVYFAAAIGAIFIFRAIALKVEDRFFPPRTDLQAVESAPR
jgi:hypothetical protein